MRHPSTGSSAVTTAAGLALILALAGCGGADAPQRAGTTGDVATSESERAEQPVQVATPRGPDEVYVEILQALDTAYHDLGSRSAGFEQLSDVQDRASELLAGETFEWPSGTSYSLSVLDDRVAVYINCDGQEKRGDWVPGSETDRPI